MGSKRRGVICPACRQENIEGADECSNCGAALYGLRTRAPQGPAFIQTPISLMPKRPVHSVGVHDPVSLAVRIMQREDANCVLVMNGDNLEGILTGWDILQKVAGPKEDLLAVTCGKVMTPNPYQLREQDTIALALNAMATGDLRHLPVSSEAAHPTGVITASDLFRYISPHLV